MRAALLLLFLTFLIPGPGEAQDSLRSLYARRPGVMFTDAHPDGEPFYLCADEVYADSLGYFALMSGCERNVDLLLGRYSCSLDTFIVRPFNFVLEKPFLHIYRMPSTAARQKVSFYSADRRWIKGMDSSWIVRCFRRRRSVFFDCSEDGKLFIPRGRYDGIELMQMTNIFGLPTTLLLDARYDYAIVVNLPYVAMTRRFQFTGACSGHPYVLGDSLVLDATGRLLKIGPLKYY